MSGHVPSLNARPTTRVHVYPTGADVPAASDVPAAIQAERGMLVGRVPSGTPVEQGGRLVDAQERPGRTYAVGLVHRLPGHSDVLVQLTGVE